MKRRKLFTLALGAGLALLGPLQAEAQEREVVDGRPRLGAGLGSLLRGPGRSTSSHAPYPAVSHAVT